MITVNVRLHATLRRSAPDGTLLDRLTLQMNAGDTVVELLRALDIDTPAGAMMVFINRKNAAPDQQLNDGDDIRLFPALSGGVDCFF